MDSPALAFDDAPAHDVGAVGAAGTHPVHGEIEDKRRVTDASHQRERRRGRGEVTRVEQEEKCADAKVDDTQRDDDEGEVDCCGDGTCYEACAATLIRPRFLRYRVHMRAH